MMSEFQKRVLFSLLLIGTLLVFQPGNSYAQRYHIQTFHEQDGVDSNTVYGAAQDSLGNIWFATRNGLTVFNGINWQPIRTDDPATPRGDGLVTIDGKGVLWWVKKHLPLKICRLENGRWQTLPPHVIDGNYTGIADFISWIDSSGQTTLAVATANGKLLLWNNGAWITRPSGESLLSIHSLAINNSQLLISTTTGLLTLDLNSPFEPFGQVKELPPGQVYGVACDPANKTMWVIGDKWLAQLKNQKLLKTVSVPDLFPGKIQQGISVSPGPNGGIYFMDESNILHFHPQWGLEIITPANGVATEGGNHVMMDREKNVWICSARGISKIMNRRLACYSTDHGLQGDEVSSVLQRASGVIVLGHRNGLTFMDSEPRTISFGNHPLIYSRVNDLTEDSHEQLWIAGNHKGLGLLKKDDSIQWFTKEHGLSTPVFSVITNPQYGVFAGTSRGLFKQVGNRFEFVPLPCKKNSDFINIRRLVPLSSGGFAIATRNCGLFFWNDGVITSAFGDKPENTYNIFTVYELHHGNLWVGTDKGLFQVKAGKLIKTTSPSPEIHRPVYAILKDDTGSFWFGTDDGVTIWDGKKQIRLTKQEGLLGAETNRDALIMDKKGHIWIGTESGVSVYRREFDTPRIVPPILSLAHIMINGQSYPTTEPLHVKSPLNSFVFRFNAPSFASEKHLSFTAETTTESQGESPLLIAHWPGILPLSNVPPGQFRIKIVGHTSDGLQTNTIITPLIIISQPLKDRWYIQTLMGLVAALLMWLVFAYFSGRRYAHRLEKEVQHRTRDLQKSEEISRLESERLSSTLESISDGVVVIDDQSRVVLFNSAAESIFAGFKSPEKGSLLEELLPVKALNNPDQAQRYKQLLDNPSSVRLVSEQVSIYSGDNSTSWLEISAVPIAGSPGGLVFAFRDITNRRQMEQNERRSQKLESLGILAGGIAHDFNNLLTIMMGNLHLAKSTLNTNIKETEQLEKVRNASKRAQNLTRQLLTFAKGGGPVREITNLAPIIKDSISFNLSGSNVTCKMELPDDLFRVNVDADQISQVIGNLVINARQAMSGGGILHISAENAHTLPGFPDENKLVVIKIQDHGIGISEKDQAQIFDPYFSTKETGTGLGLAIAHSIVGKHGGRLSVESSLGQGSTFHMVLPACDKTQKIPRQKSPRKIIQPSKPLNILFMDDEEGIRLLLGEILEELEHKWVGAAHGESAQEAFARAEEHGHPFDLVILDLTIPGGMGGLETLRQLRKIKPLIKVIVASGYSDDPVMADFQKFGFSGVLKKPFSKDDLEYAIGNLTTH